MLLAQLIFSAQANIFKIYMSCQAPGHWQVHATASAIHPEAKTIRVQCYVGNVFSPVQATMGAGHKDIPVPASGDYTSSVKIDVNMKPGKDPADAKKYFCYWRLSAGGSMGALRTGATSNWLKAKPGARLVTEVKGDLPSGSGPALRLR